MSPSGKTPAEMARIKIEGQNGWRTVIENASRGQRINKGNDGQWM